MQQEYLSEAARLAASGADLGSLIGFARAHDPTARYRDEWGSQYQTRLDDLLSRAAAAMAGRAAFDGSRDDLLLCMAHAVAAAPYLGLPEEQVRVRLGQLLELLVRHGEDKR